MGTCRSHHADQAQSAVRIVQLRDLRRRDGVDLERSAGAELRVGAGEVEGGKTRLQAFEGLLLAKKHGSEAGGTFTLRKVSNGVGVERIYPLYSPMIDSIEVVKRARVRRAKLYAIREKVARDAKRALRRQRVMRKGENDAVVEVVAEEIPAQA